MEPNSGPVTETAVGTTALNPVQVVADLDRFPSGGRMRIVADPGTVVGTVKVAYRSQAEISPESTMALPAGQLLQDGKTQWATARGVLAANSKMSFTVGTPEYPSTATVTEGFLRLIVAYVSPLGVSASMDDASMTEKFYVRHDSLLGDRLIPITSATYALSTARVNPAVILVPLSRVDLAGSTTMHVELERAESTSTQNLAVLAIDFIPTRL